MKNKYILYLIIGAIALFTSSCNGSLDLSPTMDVSDANMWNTSNDFKLAANAFYGFLPTHFEEMLRDRESDIVTPTAVDKISNSSYPLMVVESDFYSTNSYYVTMDKHYEQLRAVNYLLKNAESFEDQNAIKQYLGEAYFFRAYLHWLIFRDYGAVHYVDHVLDVNDPVLSAPRDSRDSYADRIIEDLDSAILLTSKESNFASSDHGRISKGAAQSMLAKFALFEGTWQKYQYNNTARSNEMFDIAIANSKSVIDSGEYELFYNNQMGTSSSYRYLFILENSQSNPYSINKSANHEYILNNRYDEVLRWSNANITHTLQSAHYSPTLKLVNMYLCNDGLPIEKSPLFKGYETFTSVYDNRDSRMTQSLKIPTRFYWSYGTGGRVNWTGDAADLKTATVADPTITGSATMTGYLNLKWCTERNASVYQEACDVPVIRLAEIYLTYAEAKYEKDGAISDADLDLTINKIRDRVGMPHLTNTFATANGLDVLQEIRRERTVELYAEGKRYDDLRRWKTAEVEMSKDMLGAKISGNYASAKIKIQNIPPKYYKCPDTIGRLNPDKFFVIERAADRTFKEKNYLRPIPTNEIQLNPNLVQNPGWNN